MKADAPNEVELYENWTKVFGSALRDAQFKAFAKKVGLMP